MPKTMNEVTLDHSRRLSEISQKRDGKLQAALLARDQHVHALPGAAKLFAAFDDQVARVLSKQQATDAKAAEVRKGALQKASDKRASALQEADRARNAADLAALEKKSQAEADAEREFMLAIGANPNKPSTEAQRIRAEKLAKAKKEHDAALIANQDQFRKSVDAALAAEGQGMRDADRGFSTATRVSGASAKAARTAAEEK